MKRSRGFTLIEVLIAIFILAVMSLIVYQITNNTYKGANRADKYNAVYQYSRIAMKKLTDDLSMAFLINISMQGKASDGTPFIETAFIAEGGDMSKLDFNTFSYARYIKNERRADQAEVGYYVADCPDSEEPMKCLMRRETGVIDKDVKEGGDAFAVAKNIKKFKVEYYDAVKQEWRADWSTKDPVFMNKLPRAAKITLTFYDPMDEQQEMEFVSSVLMPLSTGPIDF